MLHCKLRVYQLQHHFRLRSLDSPEILIEIVEFINVCESSYHLVDTEVQVVLHF